jgi:hypothetical protein
MVEVAGGVAKKVEDPASITNHMMWPKLLDINLNVSPFWQRRAGFEAFHQF